MDLDFSRPLIMIFIGKQASGKSFLLRNLIYQLTKQNTFKFGKCFRPLHSILITILCQRNM